ncbi:DNA polymerase-3 subunit epsilon [Faunimonas pinastri]|uniref:DNA polymerase-3 subunit epsilon n=1 Tax=Faunimonas pinastri TaxID=1855383 RepID=A0A1H9MVX3_9HYPH|nr:3'-5' exonuclease [Faunimonas pinastri]SER27818.1 DNA polymerase-3 subunit epsilon [Faunimonas pinastri]
MTLLAGTDIETTGLEPGDHRLVEFYAGLWDLRSRKRVFELNQRIDPQRSIGIEAQRVHKISLGDLVGCPTWDMVAPKAHAVLSRADMIVAHNGDGFDLPFLNYEFKRVGLPPIEKPTVDTMLQGRWATPIGKSPNLGELCFACDMPYDASKAHAADYDVGVMMDCFFAGLDWGFYTLPEIEELARAA